MHLSIPLDPAVNGLALFDLVGVSLGGGDGGRITVAVGSV